MAIGSILQLAMFSVKPSAPPVGSVMFYVKTDNVIYIQDSSGNEYPFASADLITALHGDVSATGPGDVPAVVNSVGGASASNIAAAVAAYLAATSSNTPSTLVMRDPSGNFVAGVITANLTGAASANVLKTGDTMSGNLNMGGANKVVNAADPTSAQDYVTLNYHNNDPRFSTQNVVKVKLNPGLNEFSSIATALASITTASSSNPFTILVGPGVFIEPQLVMKPYVYITGTDFDSTVIQPSNPADHLIVGSDFSAISNCLLTGVTGSNKALVYYASTTGTTQTSFWVEDVRFGSSDTLVIADGSTAPSNLFVDGCRFGATYQFNTGFVARSTGASFGKVTLRNSTSTRMTGPLPVDMFLCDGLNCEMNLKSVTARTGTTGGGGTGLRIRNGGTSRISSIDLEGWTTGLWVENVGSAPMLIGGIITFLGNTSDVKIDHPGTTGGLACGANDDTGVSINSSATTFGFVILGLEDGDIVVSGKIKQNQPDGTFTDIGTLSNNSSPMGLLSAGDVSPPVSGFVVVVSAGEGYLQKSDGSLRKFVWPDTNLTLSPSSEVYIYFDSTGALTTSGVAPDPTQNIVLGRAVTNSTGILILEESGFLATHAATNLGIALRQGLGAVYASGSTVSEVGTRNLNVTAGEYFYGERAFLSQGANPITFTAFYQNGGGGFTQVLAQTQVDNAQYDNGSGTLQSLSAGFYTKHTLYALGDSSGDFDSEAYFLVYGQAQYSMLTLVEQAALPNPPSFLDQAVVPIASIVVQQGSATIIEFLDLRPIPNSKRVASVSASSFHHNLLGLNDFDDHLRYLPVNGSRPMTGDLPMGGHNVTGAGTYNGVTVEAHASRHNPGGADALAVGTPVNIGTSNNVGSASSYSLSDHVHAVTIGVIGGLVMSTYVIGSNAVLAATDTIMQAFGKLQAQINAIVGSAITALTGDVTATGPGSAATTISVGAVTDTKASLANKPAVTVVATTNQTLSGTPTIDGQATTAGISIVLLTAQTTASENGPWVVQSGAWTRPTWYPSGGTTQAFQFITMLVRLGTVYQGSTWRMTTSGAITIDTTSTTWAVTPEAGNFRSDFTLGLQSGSSAISLAFANAFKAILSWNPTSNFTLTMPPTIPSAGQTLVAQDNAGNLQWSNPQVNIDGGSAGSIYVASQVLNGGTP